MNRDKVRLSVMAQNTINVVDQNKICKQTIRIVSGHIHRQCHQRMLVHPVCNKTTLFLISHRQTQLTKLPHYWRLLNHQRLLNLQPRNHQQEEKRSLLQFKLSHLMSKVIVISQLGKRLLSNK